MPSINNKTRKPLTVPLPGGKKLRLGPLQTGQVTPKALEHPQLKQLLDSGDLEIAIEGRRRGHGGGGGKGLAPGSGRTPPGGIQHSGDR